MAETAPPWLVPHKKDIFVVYKILLLYRSYDLFQILKLGKHRHFQSRAAASAFGAAAPEIETIYGITLPCQGFRIRNPYSVGTAVSMGKYYSRQLVACAFGYIKDTVYVFFAPSVEGTENSTVS